MSLPAQLLMLAWLAAILGCGGGAPVRSLPRLAMLPVRQPTSAFDLSAMKCDQVDEALQEATRAAVAWVEEQRDRHIGICAGSAAPFEGGTTYSGPAGSGDREGYGYEFSDDPLRTGGFGPNNATIRVRPGPTRRAPSGPQEVAAQASGTNVQVRGVDEPDIVKNDKKHVYILGKHELRIVRAWPPDKARVVGKIGIEGEPLRLFVTESEAVVFSQMPGELISRTKVTVVDIHDRAQPRVRRELMLPGNYVAARRIGSVVHVVAWQRRHPALARFRHWRLPPRLCRPDLDEIYGRLSDRIVANLEAQPDSEWLATVEMRDGGGRVTKKVGCNRYGRRDNPIDGTTHIVSLDIQGGEPSMTSILDLPGVVYASPGYLYLAVADVIGELQALSHHQPSTKDVRVLSAVHRFALDGPTARYAGSGLIAGEPINQFAMDEHDGRLRVAAHDGVGSNAISVLAESGGSLVVQGYLGDIAPDEDIRSVRFVGNRGYVVTFRQVDPLFAFDLTGGQPRQLGELKIPGYATYIHPLGNHQLLTVGFGASSDQAPVDDSVRLQLVEVGDPRKPRLVHVEVIGKRGSRSEAQREHLAFNYLVARELLLLPIDVNTQRSDDPESGFTGLMAYRASMRQGFQLLGQVASPDGWSTKRTIVMDDFVLSLTDKTLKINRLSNLAEVVAEIALTDSAAPN